MSEPSSAAARDEGAGPSGRDSTVAAADGAGLPYRSRLWLRISRRARAPGATGREGRAAADLYPVIGNIAVNWSSVEISSGFVLMELVGLREESLAQAVVAGQRVENVWDTIDALLASFGDGAVASRESFAAWRRRANALRRRRNEVIHSGWSLVEADGSMTAMDMMSRRAKRGPRLDLFPAGLAELERLVVDITALEDGLLELQEEMASLARRREMAPPRGAELGPRP